MIFSAKNQFFFRICSKIFTPDLEVLETKQPSGAVTTGRVDVVELYRLYLRYQWPPMYSQAAM